MKITATHKRNIFKKAYSLLKANVGMLFSYALKLAWASFKLNENMKGGNVVSFKFFKKDGSLREANGTVSNDDVRADWRYENVFCYFDADANNFRSFKIENLYIGHE